MLGYHLKKMHSPLIVKNKMEPKVIFVLQFQFTFNQYNKINNPNVFHQGLLEIFRHFQVLPF